MFCSLRAEAELARGGAEIVAAAKEREAALAVQVRHEAPHTPACMHVSMPLHATACGQVYGDARTVEAMAASPGPGCMPGTHGMQLFLFTPFF